MNISKFGCFPKISKSAEKGPFVSLISRKTSFPPKKLFLPRVVHYLFLFKKNRNLGQKICCMSEMTILLNNRNFGQNPNFGQRYKFWSKIEIWDKNRNFSQK